MCTGVLWSHVKQHFLRMWPLLLLKFFGSVFELGIDVLICRHKQPHMCVSFRHGTSSRSSCDSFCLMFFVLATLYGFSFWPCLMQVSLFCVALKSVAKSWRSWMQAFFHSLSQLLLHHMLNTTLLKIPSN